jgi:protein TonB
MHFTDSISSSGDSFNASERRHHARQSPHSLSYVHLDETNGGILINLSEGGLAVQAAMSVMEDSLPRVRLQTPRSTGWLEASARVIWTSDSRRMVGIQFIEFPSDFRKHLRDWLAAEAVGESYSGGPDATTPEINLDAAPEEEIMPARARAMSLPREQSTRSKEIDVAALMTSAGAAAVARSSRSVPEAANAVLPRAAAPVSATSTTEIEKPSKRSRRYIPAIAILAVISLSAGWEAGRGNLFKELVQPSAAAPNPGASSALGSAAANAVLVNFEIVDTNNQMWSVPFSGPTAAPQGAALPALPPQALPPVSRTSGADNSKRAFKPMTLTAPKSSGHPSSFQGGAQAPVLPTQSSGSGNALPNAFSDTTPRLTPVPPSAPSAASSLVPASVIQRVNPLYPKSALDERVTGIVKIHARISENGTVTEVKALSGSPLLTPAAVEAVRKWRYKPETLDGHPVASEIDVTVTFALPQ